MTLIKDPQSPASQAQVNYLVSLVKDRDNETMCERFKFAQAVGFLAKGAASEMITALLASPKKTAKTASATVGDYIAASVATTLPQPVVQLIEAPAFGYYEIDGQIYYWDVTGKDSSPTFRKLQAPYYSYQKYTWKKTYVSYHASTKVAVTYTPFGGKKAGYSEKTSPVYVPNILVGKEPLTLTQVKAKGKELNFCIRCGAALTDPVSVANGIGPVCATYWG